MANVTNVVRTLTIRSKAEGAAETTAELKRVQSAYEGVAKVSETSAKGQLSLADAVAKAERRFNTALRAQQDYEKVQRQMNAAVAQNPALQERASAVLALAAQHFKVAGAANDNMSRALREAQSQAAILTSRLGPLGSALTAIGPMGLAVGAALGAIAIGFKQAADASLELADRAGKLRDMSETIGLSVTQLQALQIAGEEVGVSSEQLTTGLERFSASFAQIRERSGEAYTSLQRIDPVLARQASNAGTLSDALNIVAAAFKKADESQRNFLSRQLFGRNIGISRVLGALGEAGGVQALTDSMNQIDLLTKRQVESWDDLGDAIAKNMKLASQNVTATFATSTLEAMKGFSETLLDLSRIVKGTDWSAGWTGVFSEALGWMARVSPILNVIVSGVQSLRSATGGGGTKVTVGSGGIIGPQLPDDQAEKLRDAANAAEVYRLRAIQAANDSKQFMQALGATATPAERLADQIKQLNAEVARGNITTDQAAEAQKRLREEFASSRMQENVSALGSAATAAERYAAQVEQLRRKLDDGRISQETFNRAVAALEPTTIAINAAFEDFTQGMVAGLLQGKSATESLNNSLKALAASASSKAISNLFQAGGPDLGSAKTNLAIAGAAGLGSIAAGTSNTTTGLLAGAGAGALAGSTFGPIGTVAGGIIGAIGGLFGSDSNKKAQEAQKAQEAALVAQQKQAAAAQAAAEAAAEAARLQQEAMERERANQERRLSFLDREFAAINDASTLAGALAAFDRKASQERQTEAELGNGALVELERALAAERLGIERDFAQRAQEQAAEAARIATEALEAVQRRIEGFGDRLFAALNDASTLEGALLAFDREAQRQREAEIRAGGEGLINLEQTLMAERLNIIEDFNERALAEEKRAAQEREQALAQAARSINDFINNLLTGPQSSLSPRARLAAAQSAYNAQIALAQGGNIAAQQGITQFADRLLSAARDVFASTAGFQSIQTAVIAQLQGLPALTETPAADVVGAVNQVRTAIDTTNTNLTIQKGVLDIINASTAATTAQVTTANALQTTANSLLITANALQGSMESLLSNIQAINVTTRDSLLASGFAGTQLQTMVTLLVQIRDRAIEISSHTGHMWVVRNNIAELVGLAAGGMVPALAAGGMVGNGIWNRDSVLARYDRGGAIMLAGGEGVINAPATRAIGGAPAIDYINANARLPANDNGALVAELRALRSEVYALRRENAMGHTQTARVTKASGDKSAGAVIEQTHVISAETRRASEHEAIKRRRSVA